MITKVSAIIFPIILFFSKYVYTYLLKAAYSKNKEDVKTAGIKIFVEFIHFPTDIIFIAISYNIPLLISNISKTFNSGISSSIVINILIIMIVLFFLPLFEADTEKTEILYHNEQWGKMYFKLFIHYIIAIISIIYALNTF